jgi:hypothetical protein
MQEHYDIAMKSLDLVKVDASKKKG